MKETTYYSDLTGEEIDDPHRMVTVSVERPSTWLGPHHSGKELLHFGTEVVFDQDRAEGSFAAYISQRETVAMIEESNGPQTMYHARDTSDDEIRTLMNAVENVLWDSESGGKCGGSE